MGLRGASQLGAEAIRCEGGGDGLPRSTCCIYSSAPWSSPAPAEVPWPSSPPLAQTDSDRLWTRFQGQFKTLTFSTATRSRLQTLSRSFSPAKPVSTAIELARPVFFMLFRNTVCPIIRTDNGMLATTRWAGSPRSPSVGPARNLPELSSPRIHSRTAATSGCIEPSSATPSIRRKETWSPSKLASIAFGRNSTTNVPTRPSARTRPAQGTALPRGCFQRPFRPSNTPPTTKSAT